MAESGVITHAISKKRYLSAMKLSHVLEQKRTREYTTLILTFVALIIFSVFAINPTLTTIVQLRKQLADSQALNDQLHDKVVTLQDLRNEYATLSGDLPLVESAVPVSPDTPRLLGQLQSLAKKHNLTIDTIDITKVPYTKKGVPSGKTASFVVSLRILGKYTDINEFIDEAIQFDRLVTVDQVTILRDKDNPSSLIGSTDVRAYFDQQPL